MIGLLACGGHVQASNRSVLICRLHNLLSLWLSLGIRYSCLGVGSTFAAFYQVLPRCDHMLQCDTHVATPLSWQVLRISHNAAAAFCRILPRKVLFELSVPSCQPMQYAERGWIGVGCAAPEVGFRQNLGSLCPFKCINFVFAVSAPVSFYGFVST